MSSFGAEWVFFLAFAGMVALGLGCMKDAAEDSRARREERKKRNGGSP